MPHGVVSEIVPATSAEVFQLLHDYQRRLEWDTLLAEAYLTDGWQAAAPGAIAVCKGKSRWGGIALKTVYISFRPSEVAAVKMVNRPRFFDSFATTIRHGDLPEGKSSVEYTFTFRARPAWLRFLLHPVMKRIFASETKKRLVALREWFESKNARKF
ncbi:MAG TPA: SRPBCC family protein [Pirellulales bacterium]|jgi:hypothetical protein